MWSQLADDGIFIDVLVLNAAATQESKSLSDTINSFQFNIFSNLHALDHFRNQSNADNRPKYLISINSASMHCYPYPSAVYAASKAGLGDYLCHIAGRIPENDVRIINLHPGAVYTPAADRAGEVPKDLPIWDDPILSAHMTVWSAGKDAGFLHGRFIWANWDVGELTGMKERIAADPAFLKIGVTGVDSFTVSKLIEKCNEVPRPKS